MSTHTPDLCLPLSHTHTHTHTEEFSQHCPLLHLERAPLSLSIHQRERRSVLLQVWAQPESTRNVSHHSERCLCPPNAFLHPQNIHPSSGLQRSQGLQHSQGLRGCWVLGCELCEYATGLFIYYLYILSKKRRVFFSFKSRSFFVGNSVVSQHTRPVSVNQKVLQKSLKFIKVLV